MCFYVTYVPMWFNDFKLRHYLAFIFFVKTETISKIGRSPVSFLQYTLINS